MSLFDDKKKAERELCSAESVLEMFEGLVEKFPHLSAALETPIKKERMRLLDELISKSDRVGELNKRTTYYEEVKKILSEYDIDIEQWHNPKSAPSKLQEEATDPKRCLVYAFEVLLNNRSKFYNSSIYIYCYPKKSAIEKAIEMIRFRAMLEGKIL